MPPIPLLPLVFGRRAQMHGPLPEWYVQAFSQPYGASERVYALQALIQRGARWLPVVDHLHAPELTWGTLPNLGSYPSLCGAIGQMASNADPFLDHDAHEEVQRGVAGFIGHDHYERLDLATNALWWNTRDAQFFLAPPATLPRAHSLLARPKLGEPARRALRAALAPMGPQDALATCVFPVLCAILDAQSSAHDRLRALGGLGPTLIQAIGYQRRHHEARWTTAPTMLLSPAWAGDWTGHP